LRFFFLALLLPFLPLSAASHKESASPIGSTLNSTSRPTIVLDAGHGGLDLGARGYSPYCEEKRISLQTTLLVKKYLSQLGYHVIMTRARDAFISLSKRVEIANKAGSDLFVSVHFNSSRNPTAKGIEVFFCDAKSNAVRTESSRRLATFVLGRLIRRTKAISRGVKKGNFYVIRETNMPAILVEGGFISNPGERNLLKDAKYLDQIARAVADGVDQYFKKK
jgi:N-acetylmuramoyl-L-alanine amidase